MKKIEVVLISIIIFLAFFLRLYKINNPIADWHSWRQADTAAVARNFAKDNFNVFYPQSDSLTALNEYGRQNPNRYFINEFPLYNSIVAILYKILTVNPALGRLVSIVFATIGTFFLYLLTKKLFGNKIALFAAFFYATNPFNIYYGRVFMPDPMYVALSIACMYFFLDWASTRRLSSSIVAAITLSLAILTKPYALFLLIPICYWLFMKWGKTFIKNKQLYVFLAISLVPFALWRIHVARNPEGTFATTWLYNAGNIRFTGAFFRWLIFERMNRLIFATGAFVLLIGGILKSYTTKNGSFIFVWLIGYMLYMVIFAKGNVTHDYYQLPIMAPGSILVALGFFEIINLSKKPLAKYLNISIALSLLLISYAFGWYEVKGFFNINHPEIVEAGQRASQLLPKDAIIIAPYNDDPTFLYQTERHGYANFPPSINVAFNEGAKYIVAVDFTDQRLKALRNVCRTVEDKSTYIIIEINSQCLNQTGLK